MTGFVTNEETENPGSIIYECVETLWGTGKARYRYACDNNSNGIKAEPVKCTDCDETFSGKRYFLQHYRAIHGGLPEHSKDNFMCDQCPNTYVSQLSLKKHISTGKKNLYALMRACALSVPHCNVNHSKKVAPVNCN